MLNQDKDFLTLEEFVVFVFNHKEIMKILLKKYYLESKEEGKAF